MQSTIDNEQTVNSTVVEEFFATVTFTTLAAVMKDYLNKEPEK